MSIIGETVICLMGLTFESFSIIRELQNNFILSIELTYGILFIPILALAWKWMEFVRIAEQVFTAFGWPDVKNIDLVARSKATPLDCKESNIREHDIGMTGGYFTTDAHYGAGFYRY